MAGKNVGGRVSITLNGRTFHPVADVEVEGARTEVEAVNNQDGTVGRSVKPKPYKAKVKLRDMGGLDLDELMESFFDFTMIEHDMKRTVILTGAFFEGTPNRNTTNGEIDGLTVVSDQYRYLDR